MVQMILSLTKFCNDPYSDDLNQFDSEIVIIPKHLFDFPSFVSTF